VYTAELIIKLFRKIESSEKSSLTQGQRDIVKSVIDYIKTNYNISIRMEDISSKLFFNKNYIGKLFKQETGMPVSDFIREIRINEACRQLRETDKTVIEIASSCGYNDTKSFYAAFKKSKGVTPNEYRKKHS
jgi:two-component system response regulator YesN